MTVHLAPRPALFVLALALLLSSGFVQAEPVCKMRELVAYGASGYVVAQVAHDELPGFEAVDFDDFGFSAASAAFGTPGALCELNTSDRLQTPWQLNTDLLVRRWITLPDSVKELQIGVAIDNDVQIWVNGQLLTDGVIPHEGCPAYDSFVFSVPTEMLVQGSNLLAVRARDRGVLAFFDVAVTAQLCLEPTDTESVEPGQ